MKKYIFIILSIVTTAIITYFLTIYNLKITNVEKSESGELITINNQKYYIEY